MFEKYFMILSESTYSILAHQGSNTQQAQNNNNTDNSDNSDNI